MQLAVDEDGRFDGALLIIPGYRNLDGLEHFRHHRDRLALIVRKQGYFVVQYLRKVPWSTETVWEDTLPQSIIGDREDADKLASEYVEL